MQALAILQKLAGQTDHPTAASAGARQLVKMIAQVCLPCRCSERTSEQWFADGLYRT